MEQTVLKATPRTDKGTSACSRLRLKGMIPGVLYGKKQESLSLTLKHEDLERALRTGARMLTLEVSGQSERVLLKEVQYNHLGDQVIHVDFARVAMDELLEIEVPLLIKGTAKGTKDGGVLAHLIHEVQVRCLPAHIPDNITVDVTELALDQMIRLGEVKAPEGVKILGNEENVVVAVRPPEIVVEAPAAAEAAPGAAEPEVIGRKPEEEEEEGGEAEKGKAK
jgi:large subunit ribosomal protein L25